MLVQDISHVFLRRQDCWWSYFCVWAWYLLHSNRRCLVDKIRLHWINIGSSVFFFLIDTHAVSCSKPCRDYSVFSFHVVGRHCLIEILGYIIYKFLFFFFFWRCSIFCSMIVSRHGVMLQQGLDKEFVFRWYPTRAMLLHGLTFYFRRN